MKYKDIVYHITEELMSPDKMGVMAYDLMDWNICCKCYIDHIPAVEKAVEICKNVNYNSDVINIISDDIPTTGYCKRYVYYFIIETFEDTDIVYYPYIPDSDHRHWINGELAFIGNSLSVYTTTLKKGINIFCVEKFTQGIPFVRIQKKETTANILSLTENNYWYKSSNFEFICDKHIQNGEKFKFTLIPLDLINLNYDSTVKLYIKAGEKGKIIFEENVGFKQTYEFDFSFIPNMKEDECERLYVIFSVKDRKGNISEKSTFLFRHRINEEYLENLKRDARALVLHDDLPSTIKSEINYYTNVITDEISAFYFGYLLKKLLTEIKNHTLHNYMHSSGAHNIYYFSNIDNQNHHYYVVLPKNYNPQNKYPLVLTFQYGYVNNYESMDNTSNFSAHFAERDDAIFADIGGDGCTMGSYTGEIFLLSEIEHILNHFPVDKKRVYAIANCAGNIAALNFVEAYPHLFAGIYTRSTDLKKNNIGNLSNIHCMYVFSGHDNWVENDTKYIKKKLNSVKFIYSNKYLDKYIDLVLSQYTVPAIDLLMSKELEEYPTNIHYRTVRNRARRAYYIEIESIKNGKEFAEFSSKIVGQSIIIQTKNCTGLKITLPPQINKELFTITINKNELKFRKYHKDEVYLRQHPIKGFEFVDTCTENICYYKGTGLLDVYLSPMRTVNCNFNDDILTKVSNVFAYPTTNTIIGTNIHYPIISIEDITNNLNYSLTIVDSNCGSNDVLDFIRSKLVIQMDSTGYRYKDKHIQENYCILQILSNPWCKYKSILYINANKRELYTKNIITRKLMIPSHSSGHHPFYNGVALLFNGNNYYSLAEWGSDFIKI